jgi:hypothetical protein
MVHVARETSDAGRPEAGREHAQGEQARSRHAVQGLGSVARPSASPDQRLVALNRYSDEELLPRAKRASPSTVARMETRAAAVFAEAQTVNVSVWDLVEERSGNYNSWYTFKAGVQRYLEDETSATKSKLEFWQRDVKARSHSKTFERAGVKLVSRLDALSVALREVPPEAPERFKSDGKAKRYAKKSKSFSIRTAKDDWRERVAGAMVGDLRLLFLLQCVTGCRPQELENGVQVRLRRDGTMVARVKGAKCDEYVGQPSRCLRLTELTERVLVGLNTPREIFKEPHETDTYLQPLEGWPETFRRLASDMSEILNSAAKEYEEIEASLFPPPSDSGSTLRRKNLLHRSPRNAEPH